MFFDRDYNSACIAIYVRNEMYGSYIQFKESCNGRYLQPMLNDFFYKYGIYADFYEDKGQAIFKLFYYTSRNINEGFRNVEECEHTQRRVRSSLMDMCLKFVDDYGERTDVCGWDKVHNDYDGDDCYVTMLERKNITYYLDDLTTEEMIVLAKELKKKTVYVVNCEVFHTKIEAQKACMSYIMDEVTDTESTFHWEGDCLVCLDRNGEEVKSYTIVTSQE